MLIFLGRSNILLNEDKPLELEWVNEIPIYEITGVHKYSAGDFHLASRKHLPNIVMVSPESFIHKLS